MFQSLTKHLPILTMGLVCFAMVSCEKDPPEPNAVIASFQYEISEDNWAEVTFTSFSQNCGIVRVGFWRQQHKHG